MLSLVSVKGVRLPSSSPVTELVPFAVWMCVPYESIWPLDTPAVDLSLISPFLCTDTTLS